VGSACLQVDPEGSEGVKKSGISGLAHTLRCAFSGAIASLADLKGLRQPNFSHLQQLWAGRL
jgi:hypothetical protein